MVRDFPPVQTGPVAHSASCTMGSGSFSGVKYGRGVLLTTHPLLLPWSWKSRAIPLPTLWATPRPLMGTLYLISIGGEKLISKKAAQNNRLKTLIFAGINYSLYLLLLSA